MSAIDVIAKRIRPGAAKTRAVPLSHRGKNGTANQRCPSCGDQRSSVYDSRGTPEGQTKRRRICQSCEHRWITIELAVTELGVEEIAARVRLMKIRDILDGKADIDAE